MAKWEKGQSGNLDGRPRRLSFDDFLREALLAKDAEVCRRLVERLVGEGAKGNIQALKLIAERTAGKPQDAENLALKNGDELTFAQVRVKLAELLNQPGVQESLNIAYPRMNRKKWCNDASNSSATSRHERHRMARIEANPCWAVSFHALEAKYAQIRPPQRANGT